MPLLPHPFEIKRALQMEFVRCEPCKSPHLVRSPVKLQQHRKPCRLLFGLITTWWARYHMCPFLERASSLENSWLERLRTELLNVFDSKPYKFRIARYHL